MLGEITKFLKIITWSKYFLTLTFALSALGLWAVWENRNHIYPAFPHMNGSYQLSHPNQESKKLLNDFIRKYPEIAMMTVVQADPVANRRTPVYRAFNSEEVRTAVENAYLQGIDGSGPLFSADQVSNEQVLSVLSGELRCEPVTEGVFERFFPSLAHGVLVHSCRIPIPPSFSLVGGWITVHFKKWPLRGHMDGFKQDALLLSLNYFKSEMGYSPDAAIRGK